MTLTNVHRPLSLESPEYPAIQDYSVVGDCRAAALVSRYGSLDWLCWPRFDSPSIFAAILDPQHGGRWSIAPADVRDISRKYVPDTNVLETTFYCANGTAVLTDLMPVADEQTKAKSLLPDHELIRQIECTAGEVNVQVLFQPRRDYGTRAAVLHDRRSLGIRMGTRSGVYWLRSNCSLCIHDDNASGIFHLRSGDAVQFSLTYAEESPTVLPPLGDWTRQRIKVTELWWKQWSARAKYEGPYRDTIVRSALALKLLTYAPSGAIVAAATTSLPERIGGPLNWDYRFCWLRDASLTIRAMLGLGYYEEADAFMNWLLHATALTLPRLCILYDVFGENAPREYELNHLRGYRDSRPVRVGNAARSQLQLDVYGEVIDAAAQYADAGGTFDRITQKVLIGFGNHVAHNWDQPDEGIWEPRGGGQNHTHSRLLCWVALDRLIRLEKCGVIRGAPIDLFKAEREKIFRQIKSHAWNPRMNSYVSVLGGDSLDASLLLLSYYGFEHAGSERMRSTHAAVRKHLGSGDLLYRYRTDDLEGTFGVCCFWEVEYLALGGGTLDEALDLFRRVSAYQNDLGLFAEEIDPKSGDALGNFPQAFTHVGLISAALSIEQRQRGEKQLPHREPSAERNDAPTEMVA